MGEGSPEVPEAVAEAIQAEEGALSELGPLDTGPSLSPAEEVQAEVTEPAEAEPLTSKPEAPEAQEPSKPDEEVGSEAPEGGDGKSSEETGPDLSHLPGDLREVLEGLPAEQQKANLAVYKSMESGFQTRMREVRDRETENEQLIGYGKTMVDIAQNDEAHALMQQAVDVVRKGTAAASPDAELERLERAITDAEDDDAYRLAVREHATFVARREVQAAQREARAPIERGEAATAQANALVQEMGVPIEKAETAWQTMQRDAAEDGIEVTPDNVRTLLRPYLRMATFSPNAPPPAPKASKPSVPKGGRSARPDVNAELSRSTRMPRSEEEMAAMAFKRSGLGDADFEGLGDGAGSDSMGDTL